MKAPRWSEMQILDFESLALNFTKKHIAILKHPQ